MKALSLINFCVLALLASTVQALAQCPIGFQPRENVCISQRMTDFIACVAESGGNKKSVYDKIASVVKSSGNGEASGTTAGVIIKGGRSVNINKDSEHQIYSVSLTAYGDKAMEVCRDILKDQDVAHGQAQFSPLDLDNESLRDLFSTITPDTPPQRLTQIFGAPIFSGKSSHSENMEVDIYQYKYLVRAFDYRINSKRLALVLSTKDPLYDESVIFDYITDVNLMSASEECGGIKITYNGAAASNICPSYHANDWIERVYFFESIFSTGMAPENPDPECRYEVIYEHPPNLFRCPGIASVPALAVAMVKDGSGGNVSKALARVSKAYLQEIDDNGSSESWLSPRQTRLVRSSREKQEKNNFSDQKQEQEFDVARRKENYLNLIK